VCMHACNSITLHGFPSNLNPGGLVLSFDSPWEWILGTGLKKNRRLYAVKYAAAGVLAVRSDLDWVISITSSTQIHRAKGRRYHNAGFFLCVWVANVNPANG